MKRNAHSSTAQQCSSMSTCITCMQGGVCCGDWAGHGCACQCTATEATHEAPPQNIREGLSVSIFAFIPFSRFFCLIVCCGRTWLQHTPHACTQPRSSLLSLDPALHPCSTRCACLVLTPPLTDTLIGRVLLLNMRTDCGCTVPHVLQRHINSVCIRIASRMRGHSHHSQQSHSSTWYTADLNCVCVLYLITSYHTQRAPLLRCARLHSTCHSSFQSCTPPSKLV